MNTKNILFAKKLCNFVEPPSTQLHKRRPSAICSRSWAIFLRYPQKTSAPSSGKWLVATPNSPSKKCS